jgi:tetratricopeptide (TPR) repeat protein
MDHTPKTIFRLAVFLLVSASAVFLFKAYQKHRVNAEQTSRLNRAVELTNLAVGLSDRGEYARAAGLLKQALLLAPGDSGIRANLTTVYGNTMTVDFQRGEIGRVLETGAAARRDSLKSIAIFYLNSRAFSREGQNDSALGLLEQADREFPFDPDIARSLAQMKKEILTEQGFEQDRSGYFDIRFEGAENREVSGQVLMLLEEIRDRVGSELGHRIRGNTSVILYSDQQFRDITHLASWAGAAFDGKIRIPVANYRNDRELMKNVLTHEFTHAAVYDLTGGRCPAWLNEGLAMLLEGLKPKEQTYVPLKELQKPFTGLEADQALRAYQASLSATFYLTKQYDWAFVRLLFSKMQQGADFGPAFKEIYGISPEDFEQRWKESFTK